MTKVYKVEDIGDALNRIYQDVAKLKRTVSGPTVMATGVPANINVDTITIGGVTLLAALISPLAANPTLSTGTYMDDIFVDVSWVAPADNSASSYDVEYAKQTSPGVFDVPTVVRTSATNIRVRALEPNTTYGFRVTAVNAIGRRSASKPAAPSFVTITTGRDTVAPPAPVGVVCARGATTVVVKFTPLTFAQAPDVAAGNGTYEIQIDTTTAFNSGNLRTMINDAQIVAFNDVLTEGTWYARVRAIDSSENIGAWSATSSGALAGGVIDSMIVAGLDAAKITVGFLSASRINAGTITGDKLVTSDITTAQLKLVGSSLIWGGTSGGDAFSIGPGGLTLFNAGVPVVVLDGATGSASFQGSVTASYITSSVFNWGGGVLDAPSGMRFLMPTGGVWNPTNAIQFIDNVSPFTARWAVWAPNNSNMYIQKVNGSSGFFNVLCNQITFLDYTGNTSLGRFYWTSSGSLDKGLDVYGYLTASSKSFVIDHPDDPENSLLVHACLEGPENGVYYRGEAKIGNKGSATVKLPAYFEALVHEGNRTVVVTPIEDGSVLGNITHLRTSRVISGEFTVFGTKGTPFFWRVEAERKDIKRLEVEMNKEELRGASEWIRAVSSIEQEKVDTLAVAAEAAAKTEPNALRSLSSYARN